MNRKRRIYRVQFNPRTGRWMVRFRSILMSGLLQPSKAKAVREAVDQARADWRSEQLAQVVIYKKNGRIQEERTYGRDPRRRSG